MLLQTSQSATRSGTSVFIPYVKSLEWNEFIKRSTPTTGEIPGFCYPIDVGLYQLRNPRVMADFLDLLSCRWQACHQVFD